MSHARFAIFAFLFALASCAYHAQLSLPFDYDLQTLALLAALPVLLKPSSLARFLIFVSLQSAAIYESMPRINTNRILQLFVGITILASFAAACARRRGWRIDAECLMETAEPLLRLELVVVYFFTFWNKLNFDFLDPKLSCGVTLYNQLRDALTWIPLPSLGATGGRIVIYATLLVEAAIPLFLLLRATRTLGVFLGFAFHFVLGLGWFYSFSATMIALLFLFVPDDLVERARARWRRLRPLRFGTIRALALAACALAAVLYVRSTWDPAFGVLDNVNRAWVPNSELLFWRAWWAYPLLFVMLAGPLRSEGTTVLGLRELLWAPQPGLVVLPLLVLFNGLCPYLGLKTEAAFAMYSNLRTEGGRSNHLLIREPLALADYQTDLVWILGTSDPGLATVAQERLPIPFYLLRRYTCELASQGRTNISVVYQRNGARLRVDNAERDPELSAMPNYLERKLLTFRKILIGTPNACEH